MKTVPLLYSSYGHYSNKKMFPSVYDGLLPVQRRMLLGSFTIAKDKFIKTASLLGYVMAHWHPHSEQVGTVQWAVQNGFMLGDGWWGTKLGSDPTNCAAPRYTEIKAKPEILKLCEFYKYVKWKEDELDPEPLYLPTPVPFILFTKYVQSYMGFGYAISVIPYKFGDLIQRLYKQADVKPKLIGAEVISDTRNLLTSSKSTTIKFRVKTYIDKDSIYVFSTPDWSFTNLLKKLEQLSDLNVSYIELPTPSNIEHDPDEQVVYKITCSKRGCFTKLVDALNNLVFQVKSNIIAYNYDQETLHQLSIDDFIKQTYTKYKEAGQSYLTHMIEMYQLKRKELDIILGIQPYIKDYVSRSKLDINKFCVDMSKKTKFTENEICQVITKHSIRSLLTAKDKRKEIQQIIDEYKTSLKNLDSFIIDRVNKLLI